MLAAGTFAVGAMMVGYGAAALGLSRAVSLRPDAAAPLALAATAVPLVWAAVAGRLAYARFSDGRRGAAALGARTLLLHLPRERMLRNVVEEVAVAAALPAPALFVLDEQPGINALALGHTPRDGALVFTDQAVQTLSRDALQAVAAHEMAHLAAGDTRLNGLLAGFATGLEAPLRAVFRETRTVLEHGPTPAGVTMSRALVGINAPLTLALLLLIAGAVLGLLVSPWMFAAVALGLPGLLVLGLAGALLARLLAAAVARQREHHADALALQLTRHPDGLADAVRAVAGAPLSGLILSPHRAALRHFFFSRPTLPSPVWGDALSAHPSLPSRLDRLGRARQRHTFADDESAGFIAPAQATLRDSSAYSHIFARADAAPAVLAAQTLAALPEQLVEAAHAPFDAAVLVAALAGAPPASESESVWTAAAVTLPPPLQLPLLEIALPALRELPPAARARLLRTVSAAVHADGHVSPWEHAVLAALRYGLGTPPRTRTLAPDAFVHALDVLLCHLAHTEPGPDLPALARGRAVLQRAGLPVPDAPCSALDAASFGPAAFDQALDQLAAASPQQQKLALAAADAAIHADGRVTDSERHLTCALALALGQPLPGWALDHRPARETAA